jgi:hypothetical protein
MTEISNHQEMLRDVYCGILAMNQTFQLGEDVRYIFEVDNQAPELEALKATYQLGNRVGESDFETAVNLLNWLNTHVMHGNMAPGYDLQTSTSMLGWAFDEPDKMLNCRDQSISLSECLLAVGIPAYPIWMFPYSPYDMDNHVVVHAYIREWEKWVMIDPTWNSYVMNADDEVLNVFEMRAAFANYEPLHLNDGVTYNGELQMDASDAFDLLSYYAKNCFYFTQFSKSCYGIATQKALTWTYSPEGFDVNARDLRCIDFKLQFVAEEDAAFIPFFEEQRERVKKESSHISLQNKYLNNLQLCKFKLVKCKVLSARYGL